MLIRDEVLDAHGPAFHTRAMADEVLYNLRLSAPLLPRPDPRWLHLLNGRLNVLTGDLEPHHPRHLSTVLLPIEYDKDAACPAIERFCAQVFPADAIAAGVPAQIIAMCACPVKGIEKSLLLLGEGANGKGIMLRLVRRFVGDANTCTLSLQDIGDDRFGTADLRGSILNLCYDLPSRRLEDSGDFKAIVSGEPVRAQRKNKPAFVFEPYCRLLFSANNLPESTDVSHGYFRRWYIVPFGVNFVPGVAPWRPAGEILAELFDPKELSGLLNLALPWMRRFLAGEQPLTSPSMDEEVEEFRAIVDPFPLWIRQQLTVSSGGWVETGALIEKYRERAERRGRFVPLNGKAVGKAIKEAFPAGVRRPQARGRHGPGHRAGAGAAHGAGQAAAGLGRGIMASGLPAVTTAPLEGVERVPAAGANVPASGCALPDRLCRLGFCWHTGLPDRLCRLDATSSHILRARPHVRGGNVGLSGTTDLVPENLAGTSRYNRSGAS